MAYQKCPFCRGKQRKETCPICLGEKIINKKTGLPPSKYVYPYVTYPVYPVYPSYPTYPYYITTDTISSVRIDESTSSVTSKQYPSTFTTN